MHTIYMYVLYMCMCVFLFQRCIIAADTVHDTHVYTCTYVCVIEFIWHTVHILYSEHVTYGHVYIYMPNLCTCVRKDYFMYSMCRLEHILWAGGVCCPRGCCSARRGPPRQVQPVPHRDIRWAGSALQRQLCAGEPPSGCCLQDHDGGWNYMYVHE